MAEPEVIVVGAGIAGLAAARALQRAGVAPLVCEAGDDVGGRVRTDVVEGFRLDRGFQVLLPAYPALDHDIDRAALRLQSFTRGAIATAHGSTRWLAGPWHGRAALSGAASFAREHPLDAAALSVMSIRDTIAPIGRLRRRVRRSTAEELRRCALSTTTIEELMRPFLAGVFLDRELETSARLFHLVWRCFLRGGGALPAAGMQALPRHLAAALPPGTVRTGTEIVEITDSGVTLRTGEHLEAPAVVVATDGDTAARLLPQIRAPRWHAVTTFYYRAPRSPLGSPTLLVDGGSDLLLNTAVISDVAPSYAAGGEALIAASVPGRADAALETAVRDRLTHLYGDTDRWDLLATYPISHALPVMGPDHSLRRPVRIQRGRYVCGDHRDTSSIQGALVSGRRAATAVLDDRAA